MEFTTIIISTIIGFIIGYFTSYFNEKGKNKAIIEDMELMTEKKEKVTSHYQLDVTKRTYKYEDKRAMYFKYFNLLDELQTEGNIIAQAEVIPAINKYMERYANANGNKALIMKAATGLSVTTNNALAKMHKSQLNLKQETNSIRLVAGERVLQSLEEIEKAYNIQLEKTGEMFKDFAKNAANGNERILSAQKIEHEKIGLNIANCKDKIIEEMKKELDEI